MDVLQAANADRKLVAGLGENAPLFGTGSSLSAGEATQANQLSRRKLACRGPCAHVNCNKHEHSFSDEFGHAASETLLITRLTFTLFRYFGLGYKWFVNFIRLMIYAAVLLPGFLQVGWYYFRCRRVHRSLVYGCQPRNRLDLYIPDDTATDRPVVIFVTGGAWVIGYKAWGALLGQALEQRGVVVVCPDYRNFPQGSVSDMVSDVSTGITWVFDNIASYGGNPKRVVLVGQSAGAHLSSVALIQQAMRASAEGDERLLGWHPRQLRAFIGVSGGYNLVELVDHFHSRGLYRSMFHSVMEGPTSLPLYSPEIIARKDAFKVAAAHLPPIILAHGTVDKSIPSTATKSFAEALLEAGVPSIATKYYAGKSHTDLIIQDPMRGGWDELMEDIIEIVCEDAQQGLRTQRNDPLRQRMVPEVLLQVARFVSPF